MVTATALGLALATAGCGSLAGHSKTYPELRDIPPPPKAVTPQADRDKLKQNLANERDQTTTLAPDAPDAGGAVPTPSPTPTSKQPAVPPKPAPHAALELDTNECGSAASAVQLAEAIPQLRGTLAGDLRGRSPIRGEGVTAATHPRSDLVTLRFDPGSAELSAAAVAALRERALTLGASGRVTVDARGGEASDFPRGAVRSLENLSLGLKRASAIANALIAFGVAPSRVEILVPGSESEFAALTHPEALDLARINFEPARS